MKNGGERFPGTVFYIEQHSPGMRAMRLWRRESWAIRMVGMCVDCFVVVVVVCLFPSCDGSKASLKY